MKTKNIPDDIKSKSLNDAKSEITDILERLENNSTNLESSTKDYERLIQLNNHIDSLFKKKVKEISSTTKAIKKNDKK